MIARGLGARAAGRRCATDAFPGPCMGPNTSRWVTGAGLPSCKRVPARSRFCCTAPVVRRFRVLTTPEVARRVEALFAEENPPIGGFSPAPIGAGKSRVTDVVVQRTRKGAS